MSMIEPYQPLGLVPTMRGIRHRDEITTNLEHLSTWVAGTIDINALRMFRANAQWDN
jgi:hypothetical protein